MSALSVTPSLFKSLVEPMPIEPNKSPISELSTVPSPFKSPRHCDDCVTVSARTAVAVPAEFVAVIEMLVTAAVVGVPEIKPVVVFTARPAGKLVAPNEVGVPLALI